MNLSDLHKSQRVRHRTQPWRGTILHAGKIISRSWIWWDHCDQSEWVQTSELEPLNALDQIEEALAELL